MAFTEVVDFKVFVSELLKNPRSIGAISPSSPVLAHAMARHAVAAQIRANPLIVELGPGTGTITAALLDAGIAPEHLYLIEQSAELTSRLRRRFPSVRMVNADAQRVRSMLLRDGLDRAGMIISSLPLTIFTPRARMALFRQSFEALSPGGIFLQYTYGWTCPVHSRHLGRLDLAAKKIDRVWRNVPPAAIWMFRRAGEAQMSPAALSKAA